MSDLFDGFSTSALNDHSSEFSISRILCESNLKGPLAEFIEKNFPAETIREQEKFFRAVNSAAKQGAPYEQLAAFLRSYQPKLVIDSLTYYRSDNDVADALKEELQNWNTPENASVVPFRCFPSKLTEQLKYAFFLDTPLELCKIICEFAKKNSTVDFCNQASLYLDVLRLYGEPFDVLLNATLSCKTFPAKTVDSVIWQSLLLRCGWNVQKVEIQEYKNALARSAKWHERLIRTGCLELAEQWESKYRSIYNRDPSNADKWIAGKFCGCCDREEFREALAKHIDMLDWQRLCHPDARQSVADAKKWLNLSFELRKSFCHPECPEEFINPYIEESLRVIRWDYRGRSRVPPLECIGYLTALARSSSRCCNQPDTSIESSTEYLHMLWCSSPFMDRYLAALNIYITNLEPSKQLEVLEYLLGKKQWEISPLLPRNPNKEGGIPQKDFPNVSVENETLTQWASALVELGHACLKKQVCLTYQGINKWLDLVDRDKDLCSVSRKDLVPIADKALAFMRKSLHGEGGEPTTFPYPLLHRILLKHAPDKFLVNMLQTFRQCPTPCSGEHLEYGAGNDMTHLPDHPNEWAISIHISNCLRLPYAWQEFIENYPRRFGTPLEGTEVERKAEGFTKQSEIVAILRKQFAQFCLKSLRLKKNEKRETQYYNDAQCTEPDPLWRQGFIRALAEIGLDLDGQVHRALNFVANHDPNQSVREYSIETYQSIRRQEHHQEADPVKGMLIAFWILRLAQRRALNQTVNTHEATRTRRNELRYATKVRYVIPYIQS